MAMKVCKLVRLTKKDPETGEFVYDKTKKDKEGQIEVRKRAVVDESTVAEYEENHGTSGLIYIVDIKATTERDEEVEKEVTESRGIKSDVTTEEDTEKSTKL